MYIHTSSNTYCISRAGVAFANARITLSDNFSGSGLGEFTGGFFFFTRTAPSKERVERRCRRRGEKKRRRHTGETERNENVRRRTSVDSRRSSRSGLVYLPTECSSPAFGPAHDLHDGLSSKDGLDFVLLTCSFDKHSGGRNRPLPRSSRWARILGKTEG